MHRPRGAPPCTRVHWCAHTWETQAPGTASRSQALPSCPPSPAPLSITTAAPHGPRGFSELLTRQPGNAPRARRMAGTPRPCVCAQGVPGAVPRVSPLGQQALGHTAHGQVWWAWARGRPCPSPQAGLSLPCQARAQPWALLSWAGGHHPPSASAAHLAQGCIHLS